MSRRLACPAADSSVSIGSAGASAGAEVIRRAAQFLGGAGIGSFSSMLGVIFVHLHVNELRASPTRLLHERLLRQFPSGRARLARSIRTLLRAAASPISSICNVLAIHSASCQRFNTSAALGCMLPRNFMTCSHPVASPAAASESVSFQVPVHDAPLPRPVFHVICRFSSRLSRFSRLVGVGVRHIRQVSRRRSRRFRTNPSSRDIVSPHSDYCVRVNRNDSP